MSDRILRVRHENEWKTRRRRRLELHLGSRTSKMDNTTLHEKNFVKELGEHGEGVMVLELSWSKDSDASIPSMAKEKRHALKRRHLRGR